LKKQEILEKLLINKKDFVSGKFDGGKIKVILGRLS
jgi:hypothetical protein